MFRIIMPAILMVSTIVQADSANQTKTFSPIEDGGTPFRIDIDLFEWDGNALPTLQSTAYARTGDHLVFIGGRTSGVHDFGCHPDNNFKPSQYNDTVYVIDYVQQHVYHRQLTEGDLTEYQIADMSSTNKLFFHDEDHLLMIGGYGNQQETPPEGDIWPGCPLQADSRSLTYNSMKVVELDGIIDWTMGDDSLLSDHI
ncbi:MAG: hypothetical protein MK085_13610, partial [Phycisphaerales bacterium]|nr:hypothetical protein [Phycisphaerales bacterium]